MESRKVVRPGWMQPSLHQHRLEKEKRWKSHRDTKYSASNMLACRLSYDPSVLQVKTRAVREATPPEP